ncbi:MAG: NAD-dependent epimerase/dehydratase family protein [Candidatus Omnitrophota bacterium]
MTAQEIINNDVNNIIKRVGDSLKRLSGKTLLITGPCGLLASYMVDTIARLNEAYLNSRCKVIGLQRSKVTKDSRLGHLLARKDIRLVTHNVALPFKIKEKVHFIIQAAGKSAPKFFQEDPLGTIDVNVNGLRWLLDYAAGEAVESVMFLSSGEIYGEPPAENIPTPETYNGNVSTLASRACYTEGKRLGETLCSIFYRKFNVPAKIVRPLLVYGPGLSIDDPRVMADFMRKGINHEPIAMLDEGKALRSYCYIEDATVAFFKVLLSDANGEVFNVGSDKEEVSIRQLAELVHDLCGIKIAPQFKVTEKLEYVKEAPGRVCPGIGKIRKNFGYEPRVSLKEGLLRTINWNLARLNKELLKV